MIKKTETSKQIPNFASKKIFDSDKKLTLKLTVTIRPSRSGSPDTRALPMVFHSGTRNVGCANVKRGSADLSHQNDLSRFRTHPGESLPLTYSYGPQLLSPVKRNLAKTPT
jgi:hypothetical protein